MTDEGVEETARIATDNDWADKHYNFIANTAKVLAFAYHENYAEEEWDRIGPGLFIGFMDVPYIDDRFPEIERSEESVAKAQEDNPWGEKGIDRYIDDAFHIPLFSDVYDMVEYIAGRSESYEAYNPEVVSAVEEYVEEDALVILKSFYDELESFGASSQDYGLAVGKEGRIFPQTMDFKSPPDEIEEEAESKEGWGKRFDSAAQASARKEVLGALAMSEEDGRISFMEDGRERYNALREEIAAELTSFPILMIDDEERNIEIWRGTLSEEEKEDQDGEPYTIQKSDLVKEETIDISEIAGESPFADEEENGG